MTVYVDDMRRRYRGMIMHQMIADSDAELHAMADAIGVRRRWFQGDHYDISVAKKAKALKRGAVAIGQRTCAAMVAHRKVFGTLGDPETAIAAWRERVAALRESSREIVEASR